jgi:hypothetical protein
MEFLSSFRNTHITKPISKEGKILCGASDLYTQPHICYDSRRLERSKNRFDGPIRLWKEPCFMGALGE